MKSPTNILRLSLKLGLFGGLTLFSWLLLQSVALASYHADHLIDNYLFINSKSMNASQIQSFLNSKNSYLKGYKDTIVCDNAYMTNHYGADCGKKVLASEIIYAAGHAYGLSPRVIMATLQKEQSLVTDPSPSNSQIRFAMGYGCPDSGSCSYPGFFTQIDWGTWQLRLNYARASGDNNWFNSNIHYACPSATRYYSTGLYPGRKVTFYNESGHAYSHFVIANAATASLYCYTPHVGPYNLTGYSGSYNFVTSYEAWWGSVFANPVKITYYDGHTSESGGTARFGLSLADRPTANVSIPLTVSNSAEATLTSSSPITITPSNYNHPENNVVTVTGVDDSTNDGDVPFRVVTGKPTSTDDAFGSLASGDVPNAALINDDNEPDGVVVGDWNGDGKSDIGLKRGAQYLLNYAFDSKPDLSFSFGIHTDTPISGDWNGNHKDDIGLKRSDQYILNYGADAKADKTFNYGKPTDTAFGIKFKDNGGSTIALKRSNTYIYNRSLDTSADFVKTFGQPGDIPLAGDWNHSGEWTTALYRPSTRQFILPHHKAFTFGRSGDTPLAGDWNGDGTWDVGLKRGNHYYLLPNSKGVAQISFTYGR